MERTFKKAKWIYLDEKKFPGYEVTRTTLFGANDPKCKQAVAHFYKTVECERDLTVKLRICADVFYMLFLNGEFIDRGPAEVGGDFGMTKPLSWRFFDELPLKLKGGKNEIEVLVSNAPRVLADISSGRAGLILEGEGEDGEILFYTDESFECALDLSRAQMINSKDRIIRDLRVSESERSPAVIVEHITPEPSILAPMRVRRITPKLSEKEGELLRFDFGKVYPAFIGLKFYSDRETSIDITYRETHEGMNIRFATLTLPKGESEYFSLQLHSARFIEIENTEGVKVEAYATVYHYDVDESCDFKCNDEDINSIYYVCKRTLRSCMMKYHLDSPIHQEPLACTGDYYIESLMNYMTYGVTALTRQDVVKTARLLKCTGGEMFHTSYSLIWVEWLLNYYDYTGDRSILTECEEALDILISRFTSYLKDGILDGLPDYMFIDWVMVDGYTMHHPPKNLGQCAMNAFFANALTGAARIKRILGKDGDAESLTLTKQRLAEAFDKSFFDEERGLYHAGNSGDEPITNWLPASNGKRYFTIQANALAALYILPPERGREIMERIMNDDSLVPCQIYFMHFVFEALARVGLFEKYAYGLLKKWVPLVKECPSSLKETLIDCITPDYSHAWGGTPAYQLPKRIFGICFNEGKFSLSEPCLPIGIDSACGTVPFDGGFATFKVTRQKDGQILRERLK